MKTENLRNFIKKSLVVSAGLTVGAPAYIKGFMQNKPGDIIKVAVADINDRGGWPEA